MEITTEEYRDRLSWSLNQKIDHAIGVIESFYDTFNENVYISFSGGLDSTVLLHIARKIYPDIKGVFIDTGQEFPEIRNFVKEFNNITWIKPKKNFKEVIKYYGYPIISKKISMGISRYRNTKCNIQKDLRINGGINPTSGKEQQRTISKKWHFLLDAPFKISEACCTQLKKQPIKIYNRLTKSYGITGERVSESDDRRIQYLKHGCNAFDLKTPISRPLSIFTNKDILNYINKYNLKYCSLYDNGYDRTGCMFCMFGIDKDRGRFERLKISHSKQYNYYMTKLGLKTVLDYIFKK